MNTRTSRGLLMFAVVIGCLSAPVPAAAAVDLNAVDYPEGKTLDISFSTLPGAPQASLAAKVTFRQGQAGIVVKFDAMKPAILYGGDVTCYVLWAVTRDGQASNLGEFLADRPKGEASYTSRQKSFAMMITAEPYYLVREPSEMVIFASGAPAGKKHPAMSFSFAGLVEAPEHAMDDIAPIAWDSDTPLVLLQARKANELAARAGSEEYASAFFIEASNSLDEANTLFPKSPKSRKLLDAARRSVALSNEAANISNAHLEGLRVQEELAARRAEMAEVEEQALAARAAAEEAESRADAARAESERLAAEAAALAERSAKLQTEASGLRSQLQGALSEVAETRDTARGYVVNLPDILFDFNKATLKPEAQVVLAKLAGILLMVVDQEVEVEGFTDSVGTREYNMDLSLRRADAVLEFMTAQGIVRSRITAHGFGPDRPIASNDSEEGRSRNRRVEIIIGDTR